MDAKFKSSDDELQQLVAARREEVIELQKSQAAQIKDLESRGQAKLSVLKKILPKDFIALQDGLVKMNAETKAASESHVEGIRSKLISSAASPENETAVHPGLANGYLVAPHSLGWFTPYYGTLHGSDGKVYWQGYNPGNIDLSDFAKGFGTGILGTGSHSFTVYMDWWFAYTPPVNRQYAHTIWAPFHGFYILNSDDGWLDSKEVHARIGLSAIGYQYNYKNSASVTLFDRDSQNINVNGRFDGWRTMNYYDLLGGTDRAYLRVTASFYVYARGEDSYAELNFAVGNANYMGMPWVHID